MVREAVGSVFALLSCFGLSAAEIRSGMDGHTARAGSAYASDNGRMVGLMWSAHCAGMGDISSDVLLGVRRPDVVETGRRRRW